MIDSVTEALKTSQNTRSGGGAAIVQLRCTMTGFKGPLAMAICHLVRSLIHKVRHLLNYSVFFVTSRSIICDRKQITTMSTTRTREVVQVLSVFFFYTTFVRKGSSSMYSLNDFQRSQYRNCLEFMFDCTEMKWQSLQQPKHHDCCSISKSKDSPNCVALYWCEAPGISSQMWSNTTLSELKVAFNFTEQTS